MKLIDQEKFKRNIDGYEVGLYTLRNTNGTTAQITNFGARLVSWFVPDSQGKMDDVVLGYDTLDAYLDDPFYFGATIGRYANRIAQGRFHLYGSDYQLTQNEYPHHLHGGEKGFHRHFWFVNSYRENEIEMHTSSFDGDDGYPGRISVTTIYRLREDNALHILFTATTDKPTVLNLTNHAYFNLRGEGKETILGHQLKVLADYFTPLNSGSIPTGEVVSVKGSPFDFREFSTIGEKRTQDHEQLQIGDGYDHNFVIRNGKNRVKEMALLRDDHSGRMLRVFGSPPGLQIYTGNKLNGVQGKRGHTYPKHGGICLEAQFFPDSPNHPHFPLTILMPEHVYRHEIIYKMEVEE